MSGKDAANDRNIDKFKLSGVRCKLVLKIKYNIKAAIM